MLDQALAEAGIPRDEVFVTNAVDPNPTRSTAYSDKPTFGAALTRKGYSAHWQTQQ
jgi:hypothetical protein